MIFKLFANKNTGFKNIEKLMKIIVHVYPTIPRTTPR